MALVTACTKPCLMQDVTANKTDAISSPFGNTTVLTGAGQPCVRRQRDKPDNLGDQ